MLSCTSRRRWLAAFAVVFGVFLVLAALATSSTPWVPEPRAPTAQQVEATRELFKQVSDSRDRGSPAQLALGDAQLRSAAALVNQGFAPYRVKTAFAAKTLQITFSRPILFRWINVRAELTGRSTGFPAMHVRVGSIPLSRTLSRVAIDLTRRFLIFRGVQIPPLDMLVRSTEVGPDTITLAIALPQGGLLSQVPGGAATADPAVVADLYCRLAKQQTAAPEPVFSRQLVRALGATGRDGRTEPARGRAALIALAILVVDPRVAELSGDAAIRIKSCIIPVPVVELHGRQDLAKHWALSAALTLATGGQFASAMGEWKELADSLIGAPMQAANDRSGFSFVDLAADRAGYLTALAFSEPSPATAAYKRLVQGAEGQVLPRSALALEEGMSDAVFLRRYGATDDPRFEAEVERIDMMLKAAEIGR